MSPVRTGCPPPPPPFNAQSYFVKVFGARWRSREMGLILLNLSLGEQMSRHVIQISVALLFQTGSPSSNFVTTKRTGKRRPRVFESDSEIEQPDPMPPLPPPMPSLNQLSPGRVVLGPAVRGTAGPRTACPPDCTAPPTLKLSPFG